MDIRDYLPPSLKHVMAYTSQAEREKRKQAARDGFGQPTPVPPASDRGRSGEQDAAEASGDEHKGAPTAALVPPVIVSAKPAREEVVRVIPVRVVVRTTVAAVLVSAAVVVWKIRATEPQGVGAGPAPSATLSAAVTPSATAPTAATSASATAVPSVTATAATSVTATAATRARPTPIAPRVKSTTDPSAPYGDAAPTVKSTKRQPHIAQHLEFEK